MTSVALTMVLSLALEPVPTVGRAAQQNQRVCRIVVEATLAVRHPPKTTARGAHQVTELVFQDVRQQDEPPADCPRSPVTEMTCVSMFSDDLTLYEPGDRVGMYSYANFARPDVGLSGTWFLADNDCHDALHGDIPMYCRSVDEVVTTGGPPRGAAMPGRRTRTSILCGDNWMNRRPRTRKAEGSLPTSDRSQRQSTEAPLRSPQSAAHTRSPRVIQVWNAVQADFNEDDAIDLAVAPAQGTTLQILLGQGKGQFVPVGVISLDQTPTAIAAGHVNRDDHVDLVVAHSARGTVALFLGDGEGGFEQMSMVYLMRGVCAMTISCGQKIQGMILKSVDYFSSDQPETEESGNHHTAPLHRRTVNAR